MKLLSLFTGIGGIDLGLEWAGIETIGQVEIDDYCRHELERKWPGIKRWTDIRTVTAQSVISSIGRPDVIAGGFPCQDISAAGSGVGIEGPKSSLWREMYRLIRTLRPTWVLIENSPHLKTRGYDRISSDLQKAKYSYWPTVVGAYLTGLPQYRDRVYILAHAPGQRLEKTLEHGGAAKCQRFTRPDQILAPKGIGHGQHEGEYPRVIETEPRVAITANGIPWRLASQAAGNSVIPTISMLFGEFILECES